MEKPLLNKTFEFAKNVYSYCEHLNKIKEPIIYKQLMRSGTSIGANIREAEYAVSKAEFISKSQISLKECYETEYWLDLLKSLNKLPDEYLYLIFDCNELKRMLIARCKTAKKNNKRGEKI